jgi:hypothetical protein
VAQTYSGSTSIKEWQSINRRGHRRSRMSSRTPDAGDRVRPGAADPATLAWMLLAAILLVLVQAGLGMIVNLYVIVPAHHPGTHSANYFAGSLHSVAWAIAHGAATLAVHATLGLALIAFVVGTAVYALRSKRPAIVGWSVLAGLFVIGAGFNGASFLDFAHNINSLIMALLSLAAIGCYATALMLLGTPRPSPGREMTRPAA